MPKGKFLGMRKEQDFTVYPRSEGEPVTVQSDKSIGQFDPLTGAGKLCTKGQYFLHLAMAVPFQFPPEFVKECLATGPKKGDTLHGILTV